MNMQLGRLPSLKDKRTLRLACYLPMSLTPLPASVRWDLASKGIFSLGGNDRYGDCVTVTAANMINSANANESNELALIPDGEIIDQAKDIDGLWGMTILERLKYWRQNKMFGSQIEAFVQADATTSDPNLLKYIIYTFGAADIGIWMPKAWMAHPDFWDCGKGFDYRPGGWGGHSVPIIGYEPHGKYGTVYQAVSWGKIVDITQGAVDAYIDEVWASILPDWYEKDKLTPSGINTDDLKADLTYVTSI